MDKYYMNYATRAVSNYINEQYSRFLDIARDHADIADLIYTLEGWFKDEITDDSLGSDLIRHQLDSVDWHGTAAELWNDSRNNNP